jgi:hypothetical protein
MPFAAFVEAFDFGPQRRGFGVSFASDSKRMCEKSPEAPAKVETSANKKHSEAIDGSQSSSVDIAGCALLMSEYSPAGPRRKRLKAPGVVAEVSGTRGTWRTVFDRSSENA